MMMYSAVRIQENMGELIAKLCYNFIDAKRHFVPESLWTYTKYTYIITYIYIQPKINIQNKS